eukprot:3693976-Ditylum_brightwellii.AAC.1
MDLPGVYTKTAQKDCQGENYKCHQNKMYEYQTVILYMLLFADSMTGPCPDYNKEVIEWQLKNTKLGMDLEKYIHEKFSEHNINLDRKNKDCITVTFSLKIMPKLVKDDIVPLKLPENMPKDHDLVKSVWKKKQSDLFPLISKIYN